MTISKAGVNLSETVSLTDLQILKDSAGVNLSESVLYSLDRSIDLKFNLSWCESIRNCIVDRFGSKAAGVNLSEFDCKICIVDRLESQRQLV